jgi:hypothetical protein
MKRRLRWLALAALLMPGCARAPAPVVLHDVNPIAVLPPKNQTGDSLVVSPGSMLEKYILHSDRVTVPDILAAEAREQLALDGFTVVAPDVVDLATGGQPAASVAAAADLAQQKHLEAAVLYIDLRRWEPNIAFQPTAVIVWIELTLIESSSGRVLWTAAQQPQPIPTQGAINLGNAYVIAARTVMQRLLAPLQPQQTNS